MRVWCLDYQAMCTNLQDLRVLTAIMLHHRFQAFGCSVTWIGSMSCARANKLPAALSDARCPLLSPVRYDASGEREDERRRASGIPTTGQDGLAGLDDLDGLLGDRRAVG